MTMDNRTLIQKADTALATLTAGNGILVPAQAKTFLHGLIKQSVLLGLVTAVPMKSPKEDINKIKFGSRIMRPGAEVTTVALADRATPTFSRVELDAKLLKGEVNITDEALEDSIEQGNLLNTIMAMLTEACARDFEELVIQGDIASADTYLAVLDGILKQATSHVLDMGTTSGGPVNNAALRNMLKLMPSEQLRDKANMKFLVSTDTELYYRNLLADRVTPLGDNALMRDDVITYSGVPMLSIPMIPDNLGTGGDRTVGLLCNPKNVHVGFWRQIRIETERRPSEGSTHIIATMRVDVKYAEEAAVVKVINVTTS